MTFRSEQGRKNVAFRAATSEKVVSAGNGTSLVGDSLRIRVDEQHKGQIIDTLTGQQLNIPLNVAKGKSTLVLEYAW